MFQIFTKPVDAHKERVHLIKCTILSSCLPILALAHSPSLHPFWVPDLRNSFSLSPSPISTTFKILNEITEFAW